MAIEVGFVEGSILGITPVEDAADEISYHRAYAEAEVWFVAESIKSLGQLAISEIMVI